MGRIGAGPAAVVAGNATRGGVTMSDEEWQARVDEFVRLAQDRLAQIVDLQALVGAQQDQINGLTERLKHAAAARRRALDELSRLRAANAPYQGKPVPVMIGFDVEPDRRTVDLSDPSWRATAVLLQKVAELRRAMAETAPGAPPHLTWFLRADPQVGKANGQLGWVLREFEAEWAAARHGGDELALHMHPWRWDDLAGRWIQDHDDEAWVLHCLKASIEAFRSVFGFSPQSYRGGDRYLSDAVVRALEDEGFVVDLTLEREPAVERLVGHEHSTGSLPDFTHVPPHAFRASAADFRIPDDAGQGLGMLALTSWDQGTLVPWTSGAVFERELDQLLDDSAGAQPTHLAFVARSDLALLPLWDEFVENMLALARRASEGRIVFATALETWRLACGRETSLGVSG